MTGTGSGGIIPPVDIEVSPLLGQWRKSCYQLQLQWVRDVLPIPPQRELKVLPFMGAYQHTTARYAGFKGRFDTTVGGHAWKNSAIPPTRARFFQFVAQLHLFNRGQCIYHTRRTLAFGFWFHNNFPQKHTFTIIRNRCLFLPGFQLDFSNSAFLTPVFTKNLQIPPFRSRL